MIPGIGGRPAAASGAMRPVFVRWLQYQFQHQRQDKNCSPATTHILALNVRPKERNTKWIQGKSA
jgi:hypothetical protein